MGMFWHDAKNVYYHGFGQFLAREGSVLAIFYQIFFMASFSFKVKGDVMALFQQQTKDNNLILSTLR